MALDDTPRPDEKQQKRWRHILGRLLALIPEGMISLDATRELRRQMEKGGELEENRPVRSFYSSLGGHDDWGLEQLRRDGVNVDAGPHKAILDESNALDAKYKASLSESEASVLAALWSDAVALTASMDANPGLHEQVDRSAWGHIANAVERVASSPNYSPGADGLPDLGTIFALLGRCRRASFTNRAEKWNEHKLGVTCP